MIRKIITIDEEKCDGCGLCARACHEGAIGMVKGKAKLLWEDHCDGLGDCLPACPRNAISFVEREAPAYSEAAVLAAKNPPPQAGGSSAPGCLGNFPIQLRLVPAGAPFLEGCHLLIAADCTAFAHGNFHRDFMQGRVTLIGCPKLDPTDYTEKLTGIFQQNRIRSVTVTRMTVPCCGGLPYAVKTAIESSGRDIPLRVVTLRPDGTVVP